MITYSLAKLSDLVIVLRILAGKLVARESDDLQALVGVLLVELLELGKLRSVATLGSGVDNEDDLALELVEGVLLLAGLLGLEIVEGDHFEDSCGMKKLALLEKNGGCRCSCCNGGEKWRW